jgi:hypothetical protein
VAGQPDVVEQVVGQLEQDGAPFAGGAGSAAVVAAVVTGVDAERIDYVAALLVESGTDARSARLRARILYLALIGGYFAEASNGLEAEPDFWPELIGLVT